MAEQQMIHGCWLKLVDAAQALGVSEITLRRKVKGGKIPHDFRNGKYYIYLHKDEFSGTYFEPGATAPASANSPSLSTLVAPQNSAAYGTGHALGNLHPHMSSHGGGAKAATASPGISYPTHPTGFLGPQAAPLGSTSNMQRTPTLPSGAHSQDVERRMQSLQNKIEQKDLLIKTLRRNIEDQQTLIAFLEDTLKKLAMAQQK